MADGTKIEWARHPVTGKGASWNPVLARLPGGQLGYHCEHASPGCKFCYAESFNQRELPSRGTGLPFKPGHRSDVQIVIDDKTLLAPLGWEKPRGIFVCSMTDLFGEFVPDFIIDRVFATMAMCPQHVFFVLTKRAERMRDYISGGGIAASYICPGEGILKLSGEVKGKAFYRSRSVVPPWPLPNVWLGVSVEDQLRADERIPALLDTPAAKRWISAEPLLGPLNLTSIDTPGGWKECFPLGQHWLGRENVGDDGTPLPHLDWVVCGGESGKNARPMHPDWARALRNQCDAAGVPYFFKQWGAWCPTGVFEPSVYGRRKANEVIPIANDKDMAAVPKDGVKFGWILSRIGKAKAGRILDGRTYDDMPSIVMPGLDPGIHAGGAT